MFSQWSERQQQACKILGYKKWLTKEYTVSKQSQEKTIEIQPAPRRTQDLNAQNIPDSAKETNIIEQTHQANTDSAISFQTQDCIHAQSIKDGEIFACQKFTLLYNSHNHTLWVLPPLFLADNQWQIFLDDKVASLWLDLLKFTGNREDYNFFQTVSACNEMPVPVICSDENIQQLIESFNILRVNVLAGEYFLRQIQQFCSDAIPFTLFISPCLLIYNNQLKYQLWFELEKYSTLNLNR